MANESEDCYFYYYSTCRKGSACSFRHEELSRGTEAICEDWEFGKCIKEHCGLRHMRIEVNRSAIACYWETQPAGCQKTHCAFRHATPKPAMVPTTVAPTITGNTSTEVRNAPSPKLDQILIHTTDTDEDSPHKKVRIKPTVTEAALAKKVSLRHLGNKTNHTEMKQTALSDAKPSSQVLEDELIEFAKRGIRSKPAMETYQSPKPTDSTVKVKKSLKELKREKILKAKLEYERKKLLISQRSRITEEDKIKPKETSNLPKSSTTSPITKPQNTSATSPIKRGLSASNLSKDMEVSHMNSNNVAEVRVKSFNEIMEEKRRRLGGLESGDSGAADVVKKVSSDVNSIDIVRKGSTGDTSKPNRPVVAARKIKLHPTSSNATNKTKPIRLKRSAPVTVKDESVSRVKTAKVEDLSSRVDEGKADVVQNTTPSNPLVTSCSEADVAEHVSAEHYLKSKSTAEREDEIGDELGLLDDSTYLKSGMLYKDSDTISDDDLMNEMEQLLA